MIEPQSVSVEQIAADLEVLISELRSGIYDEVRYCMYIGVDQTQYPNNIQELKQAGKKIVIQLGRHNDG